MHRWTLAAGVAAGLLLAIPAQALATADAVDQAFPTNVLPTSLNSTKLMAQTFTAGTTGQIDRVSLALESHSQLITGWVQIRTLAPDGSPTGGTLQPDSTPIQFTYAFGGSTYHDYTISPAFPITAGTQYAIVWMAKVGTGFWWGSNFDAYTRGQQWGACTGCGWTPFAARDLGFKTWVATTPTNQPPVAAADHPAVAVNEGTPAGNTGTFSDPDGNPVALTASSGTVTKSGTSSGTWSWSAAAADEGAPANQTVIHHCQRRQRRDIDGHLPGDSRRRAADRLHHRSRIDRPRGNRCPSGRLCRQPQRDRQRLRVHLRLVGDQERSRVQERIGRPLAVHP